MTRHLLTIILPSALTVIIVRSCGQGPAPHPPGGSEGGGERGSQRAGRGAARGRMAGAEKGTRPPPVPPLPLPAAARAPGLGSAPLRAPRAPPRTARTAPRSLRRAPPGSAGLRLPSSGQAHPRMGGPDSGEGEVEVWEPPEEKGWRFGGRMDGLGRRARQQRRAGDSPHGTGMALWRG